MLYNLSIRVYSVISILLFFSFLGTAQDNETIPAGSFIIDMGVTPQTVDNALKPYGLVYDLMRNHEVPIKWSINHKKKKDGVDFTYNGADYRGGPFIILAAHRTAAVDATISSWLSEGVVGLTTTYDIVVPVAHTLENYMVWTLDQQNGPIAREYFKNADIPSTAFNWVDPSDLGCCNDVFIMPHADPTWDTHQRLLSWNDRNSNGGCEGAIWAACHAVSALENLYNPSDPSEQMNFLTDTLDVPYGSPYAENALLLWDNHDDGTEPFKYDYDDHPIMQFMGTMDDAVQNGSEQIFIPMKKWRKKTKVAIWDPDNDEVIGKNKAAILAFGEGFGDKKRGKVMYLAGHDHDDDNDPANIAAQRAMFNFSFWAAAEKSIKVTSNLSTSISLNNATIVSATASGGAGGYTYEWSASCSGAFADSSAVSTTFTPTIAGDCIITVKVTDACGRISYSSVPITVINNPLPPTADDDFGVTSECGTVSIDLLDGDNDPEGGNLLVTLLQAGSGGVFVDNGNGTVTYAVNAGFTGVDVIMYEVCSSITSWCDSANVTVTVSGNTAPTANDDSETVQAGGSIELFVLDNDTDPEGSILSINLLTSPLNGTIVQNGNNLTFIPDAGFTGITSFTYEACDDACIPLCDPATVTLDVGCAVLPGQSDIFGTVFLDQDANGILDNGELGAQGVNVFLYLDMNGDSLVNAGDSLIATQTTGANGAYQFSLTELANGGLSCSTPTFTEQIAVSTTADGASSVFSLDLDGDGDIDILSASDIDDKIAWYENDGNQNFTERVISTTANGAFSVFAIDIDTDGDIDVLSASHNDDKIAWYENDGNQNFTERVISTIANGARSVYAIDMDGDGDIDVLSASRDDDKIAWYENDGNENFTEGIISTNAVSARNVYAIDVDGDGDIDVLSASHNDDKIAWYENDGNENFTEQTISIGADGARAIFAVDIDGDGDIDVLSGSQNDDKVAWYENDCLASLTETIAITNSNDEVEEEGPDGTRNGEGSMYLTSIDLELGSDFDPPGNCSGTIKSGLRFNSINIPQGATITNAYISFTSDNPDSPNTNNGATSLSIGAHNIDNAPAFTTTNFDLSSRPLTTTLVNWSPSIWTTDQVYSSPDLSMIVQEVVNRPGWTNNNSIAFVFSGTGSRTSYGYSNDPSKAAQLFIEYDTSSTNYLVVIDQSTLPIGNNMMTTDSASLINFIGLGEVSCSNNFGFDLFNNPPVAVFDTDTTEVNIPIIVTPIGNDYDPDGNSIYVNEITVTPIYGGTAVLNADGTITYTPAPNFAGKDTLSYSICDNGSPSLCDTNQIEIVIYPYSNDPPIAVNDTDTTEMNEEVCVGVLINDSEPEGEDIDPPVSAGTDASNELTVQGGTAIVAADGTICYTPPNGFTGSDNFDYVICDPGGLCDTATVTITITVPVNDPPVARNESVSACTNVAETVNILKNDYDVDDILDVGSVNILTNGANGTAVDNGDSTITYTSNLAFTGLDSIEYQVCEDRNPPSSAQCATAKVYFNVYASNTSPVGSPDADTVLVDDVIYLSVLDNDSDAENDNLTVSINTSPTQGTVQVFANGLILYTPTIGASGNDSFTYNLCDDGCPPSCDVVSVSLFIPFEICADGIDNDSDGWIDEDCIEICFNGIDDDGDGLTDEDCPVACSQGVDTDGDGIGDLCDIDDDNDGIPDSDEEKGCKVLNTNLIGNWDSNGGAGVGTISSDNADGTYVTSNASPATVGPGVTSFLLGNGTSMATSNAMQMEGIDQIDLSGAKINGDFLQLDFSTGAFTATNIYIDGFSYAFYLSNTDNNIIQGDYEFQVEISDDNFSTSSILVTSTVLNKDTIFNEDVYASSVALEDGWFYQFLKATDFYALNPSTSYQIRVYFYNDQDADGIIILDDIQLKVSDYCDTDGDGVFNQLDLDSDNDGIYDVIEAGHFYPDADDDGMVDGFSFGTNGLYDTLETAVDNGILTYNIADSEATPDGTYDPYELDSDGDGCFDAEEEEVPDGDDDGIAGTGVPMVNARGLVTTITYVDPPNFTWIFPNVGSCLPELCNDGIDNDNDGLADCKDCESCYAANSCDDHDNDGIGDYCDLDDDNDGIPDIIEGPDSTTFIDLSAVTFNSANIALDLNTNVDYVGMSRAGPTTNPPPSGNDYINGYDRVPGLDTIDINFIVPIAYVVPQSREVTFVYEYFANIESDNNRTPYVYNGANTKFFILHSSVGDLVTNYTLTNNQVDALNAGEWIELEITFQLPAATVPGSTIQVTGTEFAIETVIGGFLGSFFPRDSEVFGIALSGVSTCKDTDNDGICDKNDLDSDNDGIYDAVEAGHNQPHTNGFVTGSVGTNGLVDAIETFADSDTINYFISDSESTPDGTYDPYELDSDGDGCFDAEEESVADGDSDGIAGTGVPTVDAFGRVTAITYVAPPNNTWQNPAASVCQPENCTDGIDNDGDGLIDCLDADCNCSASCGDNDGDGISDLCDLDDDNDGIPDADEGICNSSSDLAAMWHHNFPPVDSGYNYQTAWLNIVADEVFGSGLGAGLIATQIEMSGVDQLDLPGAIADNDYLEYPITTQASINTYRIDSLYYGKNEVISGAVPDNYGYDFSVLISDDNFTSYSVLLNSEHVSASVPASYQGISSPVNDNFFVLEPNTAYQFRVYFYNKTTSSAVNAWYDDFAFITTYCSEVYDKDGDGIPNHLDLDSDNDGLFDLHEAGHFATDADNNGIIDGAASAFGANGLFDGIETAVDSDVISYSIADSEATPDGTYDPYELDSDGDGCFDAEEESVTDSDGDGVAGTGMPVVDANGLVTSITYGDPPNNNWQNPMVAICLSEICNDGIDNDGDGDIDYLDTDCDCPTVFSNAFNFVLGAGVPLTGTGLNLGDQMLYTNVGQIGNQSIDIRSTITNLTNISNLDFQDSGIVQLPDRNVAAGTQYSATLQYEIFESGTTTPISGSFEIEINDIDSIANSRREYIRAPQSEVSRYTLSNPTNIVSSFTGGEITLGGTVNQTPSDPEGAIKLTYTDVNQFSVTYMMEQVSSNWTGRAGFTLNGNNIQHFADCFDEICDDGLDNDGDGLTDCDDPDCSIVVATSSNSPICSGDNLNLFESGGDAVSWSWTGPNGFTSTTQNPIIVGADLLTAGTYSVTATDASGCFDTSSVVVIVNSLPGALASSNAPFCAGNDLNLTESGGDAVSWSWTGPNGFTSTSQNPTITAVTSVADGIYTVIVSDVNGCTSMDNTTVNIDDPNVILTSNSPVCVGNDINLAESGGDAVSWSWTGPDGFTSTNQNPVITSVTTAAAGLYSVTIIDGLGCMDSAALNLVVSFCAEDCTDGIDNDGDGLIDCEDPDCITNPAIVVSANNICPNDIIQVSATDLGPGTTYSWTFGSIASPSTASGIGPHDVSYDACGVDTIILTVDLNTCTLRDTVIINIIDNVAPTFTVPADQTVYFDAACVIDYSPAITGDVTDESDNCASNLDASYSDDISGLTACNNTGIVTRTWSLVDSCSNTFTQTQQITLRDTVAPVWTNNPSDITLECDGTADPGGAIAAWLASFGGTGAANDACGAVTITNDYVGLSSTGCTGSGSATVIFTATDACGNFSTRSGVLTILDTTAPAFTPVADITVDCDVVPAPVTPVVTDICDPTPSIVFQEVVVQHPNRNWSTSGTCSILYTVSDASYDDKGTGSTADDEMTFVLTVIGQNTGSSWSANVNGTTISGNYYQTYEFGPLLSNGSTLNFSIIDDADPTCTSSVFIDAAVF